MERFKKGDTKAFEELLRRHRKPVFNFCFRMLGNRTAAEDALQEVFLRVVRGAKKWERTAKFRTWLYTIARNHCIDALRKAKFRKTASLDQPLGKEEDGGETLQDKLEDESAVSPDRGAAQGHLRDQLRLALAAIPEAQREVFILREMGGIPFKEIAVVVGVSENTVKSRMRYALERLRSFLQAQGIEPGTG